MTDQTMSDLHALSGPQTPSPLATIVRMAGTAFDILRDLVVLALFDLFAAHAAGAGLSLVALLLWGLMLAKYLSLAIATMLTFEPLATRLRERRVRLVAICATIALAPQALLFASYGLQSGLRSSLVQLLALARGA